MEKDQTQSKDMQDRMENIARVQAQLEAEGYQMKDETFPALTANLMIFATGVPISILLGAVYLLVQRKNALNVFTCNWKLVLLALLISIPVHEFLHGLGFVRTCRGKWKSIGFGFQLKALMPYCFCKEALSIGAYLFGALLPCTVLGLIPSVIAIAANLPAVFLFGILNILIASGDLTIVLRLLRYIGKDVRIFDHPVKCGSIVFLK